MTDEADGELQLLNSNSDKKKHVKLYQTQKMKVGV